MSYLLGIDVGTTRTAAAIGRSGARPSDTEIVNLGDRSSAVPSVLYIGDDGSVVVGEAAERRAVSSPDHVVREFKRRIGDPTPILVAGRPWAPEELSARLVRWVVDRAAQREGGPAMRVAVAHPASWGSHKKDRLGAAVAAQGVPITFIAEPQAAALHYAAGERVEPGSTIAVYDLGGGTFDAAVVHKDDHGFTLLGRPEGIERLGGIDFDEVVFEHVRQGLPEAFDGLDETDPAVLSAVAAVRRECTEAKEALSSDTEVSIQVMTPAGQGSVRLHRSEFEAMIRPRVEETVDALRRAVGSAGLAPAQLSAVLLVGGSSRIPLVGQLVSEQLGRPVAVDADPKNAIAMGAALSLRPPSGSGAMPQVSPARPGPAGQPMGAAALAGAGAPMGTGATPPIGVGSSSYPPRPGYGEAAAAAAPAPTQWMSGSRNGPMPPAPSYPERPQLDPDDGRDFIEYADRPRGPSAARLVTIGGIAAAIAVVAAIALWPTGGSVPLEPDVTSSDPPISAVTDPGEATPEPEQEPDTDPADHGRPGSQPAPGDSRPPDQPVPTTKPAPTTDPVEPTTTPSRPTSTTTNPTTTRPTPTTTPPTTTTQPTSPPPSVGASGSSASTPAVAAGSGQGRGGHGVS
ncbi:Hsp70 family protein [Pseudonocardia alaniniphila]|uniref:Hsp70 family protein n=1 Tax=Pseudonocardia alaniniphila TaxID=75291 RepID=A0ABS9TCG2_9PSEU|nr:Hsp70 family protein [Pseudonocardia alaniniphila]MCH6165981.1 Hsp70 family protein [Pseudonocardia alaniniphila]